jgi:hypothetical protein
MIGRIVVCIQEELTRRQYDLIQIPNVVVPEVRWDHQIIGVYTYHA